MHDNGITHRDFYLCHFLFHTDLWTEEHKIKLSLIDLHRAQIRTHIPNRWLIKDLAALFFSCSSIILTERDCYRFIKIYEGTSLRKALLDNALFWKKVKQRGQSYRDHAR